ncbi:hypothetical protein [Streptomyces sp. NPDC095613]|uniref:hypothetical protein n=1 Tax=Streptomyces sp. NPDC095613 TaxID=3155540 RepID=UPI003316D415
MLQEAGIYSYRHALHDAIAYRSRLDTLQNEIKTLARGGRAVQAATDWTVNGSKREGQKMVRDFSKLMLRAHKMRCPECGQDPSAIVALEPIGLVAEPPSPQTPSSPPPSRKPTRAELERRVAALEAENARLRTSQSSG